MPGRADQPVLPLPEVEGLAPRQLEAIRDATARLNVYDGSVSSGKTIASLVRWLTLCAMEDSPQDPYLMAGRTLDTLKRNVLDLIPEAKVWWGSREADIFGRKVYLGGAHDARSEGKIRGLTVGAAYGDELTLWPQSYFTMLLSRLRRKGALLIGTTNPDAPRHWLKTDFLDRPELNLRRFHFQLEDNPFLPSEYVEELKKEYTGLWYRRFILGEWVIAEGAIYEGWDDARYVLERLPAGVEIDRWWVGVDYGTAASAFVALLGGLGSDGRVYVLSELRWDPKQERRQKTDAEYVADVISWITAHGVSPEYVFVDPSAASFIEALWRDLRRVGLGGVMAAENAVLDGIRTCASALHADRVRVLSSCTGLIGEFPGYTWDPRAQDRGEDAPLKQDDHSLDAWRYLMMGMVHVWARTPLTGAQ